EASGNGRLRQMKVTVNIIINFNQKTVKMEKKNFLLYETPEMEVLKMSIEGFFCASGDDEPGGHLPDVEFEDED
ncbi:MAG: hypothetical protein IJS95_07555, partial [Prevotella sp.]|nr:hypothetical protein [Prevotella sp.]